MHWEESLSVLPRFSTGGARAFRPGLKTMTALLRDMGNPHLAYPCVHVAGTNGKGSTASLLSAIGTSTGRRMALHTSPHLCHVGERMRINGTPASAAWLASAVGRYRSLFVKHCASYFEATTALALQYFADNDADCAVIETGLGGRLDATNVIVPVLSIITHIDLDHTDILGHTIAQIAAEKGGIIKPDIPVITGCGAPAANILREMASERRSAFHEVGQDCEILHATPYSQTITVHTPMRSYQSVRLGLAGYHQTRNAVLAIRAAEQVFAEMNPEHVATGLRKVCRLSGLRGRLEPIKDQPLMVLDVAHNPASLVAALQHVRRYCTGSLMVLFAAMKDKAVPEMASALAEARASVLACSLESDRAMADAALSRIMNEAGVPVIFSGSVSTAWHHAHSIATENDAVLVAGSHQLIEQVLQQSA